MIWPTVTLGDLARPRQWPILAKADMTAAGYPLFGANGRIGFAPKFTHERPTLIVGCRGSCGSLHIAPANSYVNGNAMALDELKSDRILISFLYRFLEQRGFSDVISGSSQPQITGQNIARIEVPLPPLDEQLRIAAILDQAEELRRKRELALKQLESLPRLVFQEFFGDLVSNERGWRPGTVSDLIQGFASGRSLVAADEDDTTSPFRVLKISSVTSLNFVPTETKPLPRDYLPPGDHLVRRGDLLFSRANTSDLIGATALVDCDCEGLALPDKLWRFRWYADGRTDAHFVWQLFMEPSFRDQIRRRATGTSGSMKNISQNKVMGIEIGIPDPTLQTEFGVKFAELRGVAASMRHQQEALGALFASLQHRAFTGQLTRSDERLLETA